MNSKAFDDLRLSEWMSISHTFPPRGTSALERSGTITAGESFEGAYSGSSHCFDDIGLFFGLPRKWAFRESIDSRVRESDLPVLSSMLCDAWVYLCWLKAEGRNEDYTAYKKLIQAIVGIENLWTHASTFELYHYHQRSSNFGDIIPGIYSFIEGDGRLKKIWNSTKVANSRGVFSEGFIKAEEAWLFLGDVFKAPSSAKEETLKKGLNYIAYATLQGDSLFFETLGKALSSIPEVSDPLPFKDFRESVLKNAGGRAPSTRAFVRRIWLTRGLFLLPRDQLVDRPFGMSSGSMRALTQPAYWRERKERNKNAEGLSRSDSPWFEVSRYSSKCGEEQILPLTDEGKKHLPDYSETGFPWSAMTADLH